MEDKINSIQDLLLNLIDKFDNQQKEILNIDEVADFTSLKKSYIYKLNSKGMIPSYSYSSTGKLYFKRTEILEWMTKTKRFYKDDINIDFTSI